MKISWVLGLSFLAVLTAGCRTDKTTSTTLDSWFKTQQDIAAVLNKYNGGPRFKIAAITGAIYPLGTTFYVDCPPGRSTSAGRNRT